MLDRRTGTSALRVVPLMRREKTAKRANKPLRITASTFCNGMMTRGTVHTDTIRRYATSLDPPLDPLFIDRGTSLQECAKSLGRYRSSGIYSVGLKNMSVFGCYF
jgi:hypothetical protein